MLIWIKIIIDLMRFIAHLNTSYRHFFLFIHEIKLHAESATLFAESGNNILHG